MTKLEQQILTIIKENDGIKAAVIAKQLGIIKKEVNSILYSNDKLKPHVWMDSSYGWHAKQTKMEAATKSETTSVKPAVKLDSKLAGLCHYYLNCLSLEQNSDLTAYLKSDFGPASLNYCELDSIDDTALQSSTASDFISRMRRKRNVNLHVGYPVFVKTIHSRKRNQDYLLVAPVMIFDFDTDSAGLTLGKIPRVNLDVIKEYSCKDVNEQIYELISLEKDLGLDKQADDIELDDLAARLQNVCSSWPLREELDPLALSKAKPISDVEEAGIYNRSIIVASDKPIFTQGLESELSDLSKIDADSYRNTALYKWLYPNDSTMPAINQDEEILAVLSLNTEQEQAVRQAFTKDLTIVTGPPGTGKSQVVTDLILNAAWKNNSVLFASKNNKAVDVVEMRANGLSKRPIMLRMGGTQYVSRLAEIIENMLNAVNESQAQAQYNYYRQQYQVKLAKNKTLKNEKSTVIELRNRVDKLEHKYGLIRQQYGKFYTRTSDEDIQDFESDFKLFKGYYTRARKGQQSFLVRMLWPFYAKKRQRDYADSADMINDYLTKYKLKSVPGAAEDYSEEVFARNEQTVVKTQTDLQTLVEYKDALTELTQTRRLEEIDREIYNNTQEMADLAVQVWDRWLAKRQLDITPDLRQKMTSYIASVKLIGNNNLADTPQIQKQYKALQQQMTKLLPCWAVTSLSAKGRIPFEPGIFDLLIIDEASQCDIASALPLLYRAKRAVIIGDPKQLSHISAINSKQDLELVNKYSISLDWSYSAISLYGLSSGLCQPDQIVHLRDHHRSVKEIIEFSNQEFYDGRLRVATNYSKLSFPRNLERGIRWIDVEGNTLRPNSGGAYNDEEVGSVVEVLRQLVKTDYKGTIGVVTPFRSQAERIRTAVEQERELRDYLQSYNEFLVDTVHKFQGDERDVMIFSTVISKGTPDSALRFLSNTGNLFNVAITRARSVLAVVGDINYCTGCQVGFMQRFAQYVRSLKTANTEAVELPRKVGREYPFVDNPEQVSEWEKYLYTALFDAGISTTPQYPVDKYKLDLALFYKGHSLDIEVDGELYHKDWNGELCYRDQLRNQRLFELGWEVRRFWVYQVRDEMELCVAAIKKWQREIDQMGGH